MESEDIVEEKITFFKRMKLAIFKLEDYSIFLGERLSVAFKYFFLLLFFATFIISIVQTYDFSRKLDKVFSYVENELPDFKYENDSLIFEKPVNAYDSKYDFKLFINTDKNIDENLVKQYRNEIYDSGYGLIALSDKIIFISDDVRFEENYSKLVNEYNLKISNKSDLVSIMNDLGKNTIVVIYFIVGLAFLYVLNIITILSDVCLIAVFGWLAARICGIGFKLAPVFSLAIYSLTLSIILRVLYICVLTLTGFVVQYFEVIYLLIAYVYIIAAIFMIKYDLIKQTEALQQVLEVQKKIHEELDKEIEDKLNEHEQEDEKEKENKKDNKEDKKKREDTNEEPNITGNNEPDGSEI